MCDPNRPPKALTGLCHWLLRNGYAEDKPGYGHVSAEELATALVEAGWVELDTEEP